MFNTNNIYPWYLKLHRCPLLSLTRIADLSRLIGIRSLTTWLLLHFLWVYAQMRIDAAISLLRLSSLYRHGSLVL
ncbi:hypothetical protein A6J66_011270 [Yersinia enterocolitica]|nr:hypothetical protein A6J66_011270 [Yersinia enterocolitica]